MRDEMTDHGPEASGPPLEVSTTPRPASGTRGTYQWKARAAELARPSLPRDRRSQAFRGRRPSAARSAIAIVLVLMLACGNGTNGYERDVVTSFTALTLEEQQAITRMRAYIADAERLLASQMLTAEQQSAIQTSISDTRTALTIYVSKREIGSARSESIMVIQGAALAIVRDDVTGAGISNDWLLIGAGIAWIGTLILTDSPLPRDEIEAAWATVGKHLDYLGRLIEATRPGRAEPLPAPPRISDLPGGPPANDNVPTTMGSKPRPRSPLSPSPVPQPLPKKDDDGDRDRCKPQPKPHIGGDNHHNWCADVILHNLFPKNDVWVNGKRFDALDRGNMLYEVRTHNWTTYEKKFLQPLIRKQFIDVAKSDRDKAYECGFRYAIAVADDRLYQELLKYLPAAIVRHVPECKRKAKR